MIKINYNIFSRWCPPRRHYCYVTAHFVFLGNIQLQPVCHRCFCADHVFMKSWLVYPLSAKKFLLSVNHKRLFMQLEQNSKHNNAGFKKGLKIVAGEVLRVYICHRNSPGARTLKFSASNGEDNAAEDNNRKPRSRRTSLSTAKAMPSTRDRGEATATSKMYRDRDKIPQLQCKGNRWREGTATADASRKCRQRNSGGGGSTWVNFC